MYQAKEGVREGGLLVVLSLQPQDDPRCFLQEEEHIVRGGVDPVISQEHRAIHGPSIKLVRCPVPACNGGDLLISHQHTCVRKGS